MGTGSVSIMLLYSTQSTSQPAFLAFTSIEWNPIGYDFGNFPVMQLGNGHACHYWPTLDHKIVMFIITSAIRCLPFDTHIGSEKLQSVCLSAAQQLTVLIGYYLWHVTNQIVVWAGHWTSSDYRQREAILPIQLTLASNYYFYSHQTTGIHCFFTVVRNIHTITALRNTN